MEEDNNSTCSICFESFTNTTATDGSTAVVTTECGHRYHQGCLTQWTSKGRLDSVTGKAIREGELGRKVHCPLCNAFLSRQWRQENGFPKLEAETPQERRQRLTDSGETAGNDHVVRQGNTIYVFPERQQASSSSDAFGDGDRGRSSLDDYEFTGSDDELWALILCDYGLLDRYIVPERHAFFHVASSQKCDPVKTLETIRAHADSDHLVVEQCKDFVKRELDRVLSKKAEGRKQVAEALVELNDSSCMCPDCVSRNSGNLGSA